MAVRQMRFDGDEILRKKCKSVKEINERTLEILRDMMDTLDTMDNGAALAANQLGILKRLVVIDYCEHRLKLINPEIIESEGTQDCIEGCLSFPGRYARTIRPQKIIVRALDEEGRTTVDTYEGEMAKCFCHELEHLDGIVFLDHAVEEVTGEDF